MSLAAGSSSLLIISPRTYNYHTIIQSACARNLIDFRWLDERPFSNFFYKVFSRFFNSWARIYSVNHYIRSIDALIRASFSPTHILVVKGESIHPRVLDYLKSKFSSSKFILYFWDSTLNLSGYKCLLPYFDLIASFDSIDCLREGWVYYPLFAGNVAETNLQNRSSDFSFDWSFVGAVHSDRINVIFRLLRSSSSHSSYYLYLYLPSLFHGLYYFLRFPFPFLSLRRYMHFSSLSSANLSSVYTRSKCILDIHHPGQHGLTMRSIEAIFSGRKLATTNDSIYNDLFYHSSSVLVIDRLNPIISRSFLDAEHAIPSASLADDFDPVRWLFALLQIS